MENVIYSAVFEEVTVSAAQDFFEIVASPTENVRLIGFNISQSSDAGDAAAEQLNILIHRGTTSGSAGSAVVPAPVNPGDIAFGGTVEANNTTQSTEGVKVMSACFNIAAGIEYWWPYEVRPVVPKNGRIIIELQSTPADALTMSGTVWFETVK
jgi:hypothetical protein